VLTGDVDVGLLGAFVEALAVEPLPRGAVTEPLQPASISAVRTPAPHERCK
jgi:hypothetical protein